MGKVLPLFILLSELFRPLSSYLTTNNNTHPLSLSLFISLALSLSQLRNSSLYLSFILSGGALQSFFKVMAMNAGQWVKRLADVWLLLQLTQDKQKQRRTSTYHTEAKRLVCKTVEKDSFVKPVYLPTSLATYTHVGIFLTTSPFILNSKKAPLTRAKLLQPLILKFKTPT